MKLTKFPVIDRVQKCFSRRDETEIFDRTHRFEKNQINADKLLNIPSRLCDT